MRPTIKLITFDLDNTLWPVDEVILAAEHACLDWIQQSHPDLTTVKVDDIRRHRDQLLQDRPEIAHNMTQMRTLAMQSTFEELGFATDQAEQMAQDAFRVFIDARNRVSFYDGAIELLETLYEQTTLGALSNGNACLKTIGIHHLFAFHHTAETIGKAKPHPEMFETALKMAEAEPHESIHIGDHPEQDILAAKQVGMRTIWINSQDLEWPYPEPDQQPDRHVHNTHELLHAIESLMNHH